MADILKLAAVFLLIVLLLRRKMKIGWAMLLCSGLLALLYGMPPATAAGVLWGTLTDGLTLKLTAALLLIRMLELVMREREVMAGMMEAAKALLKGRRAVVASMPLLIGTLPSVGGAYFSAPMVEEASKGMGLDREEKAFVNYWFRHPWEFVLPLYPGVVLAAAVSGVGLRGLIGANLACAAAMAAAGFLLSMRGEGARAGEPHAVAVSGRGLMNFLPVASVLALVVLLDAELYVSLLVVLVGLLVFFRYGLSGAARVVKEGASLDVIVLIVGIMAFKGAMESSHAVGNLSAFFKEKGVPLLPMLFLLPFVTGALTGLTVGFVSATFPLLLSLEGGNTLAAVSFAFASGFVGVLLSPVHVCLILTAEYFKAEMGGIYRRMLLPAALVLLAALAVHLVQR